MFTRLVRNVIFSRHHSHIEKGKNGMLCHSCYRLSLY